MSVGENIKNRRIALRMSQQQLADIMGYKTRSTIAKIESGDNDVSQKKLMKFAAALNTTVEHLMLGHVQLEEDMPLISVADVNRNRNIAVILAGGNNIIGNENIPAQYISVHGKPIIVYAMEAYQAHPVVDDIYVVCARGWESIVKAYVVQFNISKVKGIIPAGESGVDSLKNAIDHISCECSENDYIIIQEATRPMVSVESISNILKACYENNSATYCHSMSEYVQFIKIEGKTTYIDRNAVIALQSPEAHRLSLINDIFKKAYKMHHRLEETCCSMLMYNLGYDINYVESGVNNIKISRLEDVAAFGAMLRK